MIILSLLVLTMWTWFVLQLGWAWGRGQSKHYENMCYQMLADRNPGPTALLPPAPADTGPGSTATADLDAFYDQFTPAVAAKLRSAS